MVRAPKLPTRVVARYVTVRVDDVVWAKAYDQGNVRFEEADLKGSDLLVVRDRCREYVNKSYQGVKR